MDEDIQPKPLGDYAQRIEIGSGATALSFTVRSIQDDPDIDKASLLTYLFHDAHGKKVEPNPPYSENARLGPYFYLSSPTRDGLSVTRKTISVPECAVTCEVRGVEWKKDVATYLIRPPVIRQPGTKVESVFESVGNELVPIPAGEYVQTQELDVKGGVATVHVQYRNAPQVASKALLIVEYLDEDGTQLLPTGELAINPDFGPYIYLESPSGEERSSHSVQLTVPSDCSAIRFRGRSWSGSEIELVAPIDVEQPPQGDAAAELLAFINRIPENATFIVIYTTARAIGNGSLLLRSNRLAIEYAKAGHWVLFFPFGSLQEDEPTDPHPRIHQTGRTNFRLFMDLAMKRSGANNKFICSSFSDLNVAASIDRMRDHGWTTVYEVRDDMEEFSRVGYSKWYHPILEARVAKRVDKIMAVSPRLQEKVATIAGRSDVELVPNAAPDELVRQTTYLRHPESIGLRRESRTVGYIGHLTPSWFDWNLLKAVAKQLPSVQFEIIGHEFPQSLSLPANVTYLGAMPHAECIPYAEKWRAGLIPFKISPLTYGVDPNKIYEYVAMGLRTVTAPMGAVETIPGSWVYDDIDGAVAGVVDAVTREITADELSAYDEYIVKTKWSDRAGQMLQILGE